MQQILQTACDKQLTSDEMRVQFPPLALPRFRASLAGRNIGPARQARGRTQTIPVTLAQRASAGWPWRLPTRAPTDPYVLILEHTVPQPTVRRSRRVPVAIRPSSVDMRENLDVFNMFPSVESAGRRFASLDRVLRGEFPCFHGTIKALRLPAAHPAALRCLSLETSRVVFSFFSTARKRARNSRFPRSVAPSRPEVSAGSSSISPSS